MATHIIDKITDLLGNVFTFKDNSGDASSHTHNIANVNGLQSALNNKADKSTVGYFRTKSQHISMGANLVVNGNGRNGDNYNFTSFKRYPTIVTNGAACSFGFNGYSREDEYMSCDFTKKILLSVDIKNLAVQPTTPIHRIYIEEYDIDKNAVRALNVMYGVGTLTELSQDLKPGDTVVHLNDLSNNNWKSSTTHHRGFIFWNYKNSFGYQYEPETYSRNVYPASDSTSLWEAANVDQANNTITLNSPWSGPLISAGTKVSRRSSGTTFPYPANASFNDLNWHHLVGTMNGVASVGTSERTNKFSQGVAYFKVGVYPSNLTVAPTTDDRRAVLANLSVYELPDVSKGINGTLPIANGGTGATTPEGADYNITAAVRNALGAIDGNHRIVCAQTSPSTALGNLAGHRTFNQVWDWIKSKIKSVLGLDATNYDGTAAKATADASGNTITTTYATKSELTTHTSNTSNPHNVTKSQVGLGNVDNTSDTDKPISTATQTALNGKQDSISDIATIRSNATNGQTAYGWGNHANAGYLTEADLSGYETSAHAEATYAKNSAVSAGFNNVGASIYSLGTALDTERDARVASDESLQGNINSLSQSVSDTNTALNEETAARVDAVSTINATLLNKANTDGNNATGTWPISVAGFRNYDWQTSRTLKIDLGSTTQNYVTIKLQGSMRNDSTGFIYCYPLDLDIKCLHTGTPVEIQALGVTYYANGNPYYVLDVTYKGNVIYISRSSAAAFTAYTRLTLEIGCTLPNNVILTTIDNTEIPSDALSPVNSNKVPTVNSLNALGSTTKPVYVNSNGNVVECDIGGMTVIIANGTLDTNITEYFMCSNVTLTVPFANIKTGVAYKIWRYDPAGSGGTPALSITGINSNNKLYYNGSTYTSNKTIGGKASGSLSASTNSPMVIIRNRNNLYVFGY